MYGGSDIGISRFFALYLAQAGWIVLGIFLYSRAYWPSSCRPETLMKVYLCSARLPENRGWLEAALMTWLWSTPILIVLEAMRWRGGGKRR